MTLSNHDTGEGWAPAARAIGRADPQHMGILGNLRQRFGLHDLGNHGQATCRAGHGEQAQAVVAQSLERVGRGARFAGTTAKAGRAVPGYRSRGLVELGLAFDRFPLIALTKPIDVPGTLPLSS